uniref:KH domain-containing protein n=1 Tax=Caenorhabditis japonica TaxID=281687 RepID=A0A8R1EBA7_CAEJA
MSTNTQGAENVDRWRNLVQREHCDIELFYMVIPASKCGLVIGKNGDNIKSIMAQSGAHCELSKEPEESPVEKTFLIKGEDFQVEHAKHLICIAVGEIPPNTPFSYQGNAPAAVAPTYPTPTYPTPIATQPQTDFSDQWLQYYMSIGDYQSVEMTKAHMQMKMMNNGQ